MRIKQLGYDVFLTVSDVDKIEQMIGKEIPLKLIHEIEIGCKCDICEKPIELGSRYFHVLTGHRDWLNNSQQWFDICSQECLQAMYMKFDEMPDNPKFMEVSHTMMSRKYGPPRDSDVDLIDLLKIRKDD